MAHRVHLWGAIYKEARMIAIRPMILLGLTLCLSQGGLLGCTSQAINTREQNSLVDLLARCEAEFRQGNTSRAIETASEAIRLTPDRAAAWNARGFLYASQGSMGQAREDFAKAAQLNPTNATYQRNIGVAYLESGNADLALEALNQALRLEPQSAYPQSPWHGLPASREVGRCAARFRCRG